jgi:hypothetical protein
MSGRYLKTGMWMKDKRKYKKNNFLHVHQSKIQQKIDEEKIFDLTHVP